MVRVGVPADIDEALMRFFPPEAELRRIRAGDDAPVEVEFWIPPLLLKELEPVAKRLRGVKVVQALWAGVDALLPYVPAGAMLCDAQGVHDIPVAEYVVGVMLAMFKYLPFYVRMQDRAQWKERFAAEQIYREAHPGKGAQVPPVLVDELAGRTVLIVGYGSIGRAVEERLLPFGVKMLRVARRSRDGADPVYGVERLGDLLPEADVVVVLVPLTAETQGMFGRLRLAKMKHAALLVNVARGPVVDTNALVEALEDGRIHAAVDVTDPEPLPDGHPLWSAPNVLLTPHVAGSSSGFMERAFRLASEQVRRYLAGEPLENVVREGY